MRTGAVQSVKGVLLFSALLRFQLSARFSDLSHARGPPRTGRRKSGFLAADVHHRAMRSLLAFLAIAACSLGCRDGSSPSNAENRPADEVATATTASASADPGVVEKDCDLVFEAFLGKTPVDLEYPANAEALAAARTKLKGIVELWRDLKPKLQTGPLVAEGNAYAKLVEARIELFTK